MNAGEAINKELDSIRHDIEQLHAWRNGDLDRANARHAELAARLDALEKQTPEPEANPANEAMLDGVLYRWDGEPLREPEIGEVFAGWDGYNECSPIELLVLKDLETTFGPRRIFVPVKPTPAPDLPDGISRGNTRSVIADTKGGVTVEVVGVLNTDCAYKLLAMFSGGFLTISPHSMAVELTTDQWRELLEVQNA